MNLTRDYVIMPKLSDECINKLLADMKEKLIERAKANYRGLVVTIFQGLYVYQTLGVNITPYREVKEAVGDVKRNAAELTELSHSLVRQLVRRPTDPFKEPETEFDASLTLVPVGEKMLVIPRVLNATQETIIRRFLDPLGAEIYYADEEFPNFGPEAGAIEYGLVNFETEVADKTPLAKEYIYMLCVPDAALANIAAKQQLETEKFGEYIRAKNEAGELAVHKACELCAGALNFAQRFVEENKEAVDTLAADFSHKLNIDQFFAEGETYVAQ